MNQFYPYFFLLLSLFLPKAYAQSWEAQAIDLLPINYGVYDVSVVNDSVVWAVAYDINIGSPVPSDHLIICLRSIDGGLTWEVDSIEEAQGRISFDIVAFGPDTAFITTQNLGSWLGRGIYRTTDGGKTWMEVYNNPSGGVWIRFFNRQEGIVINRQSMARTDDGGNTWTPIPSASIPSF